MCASIHAPDAVTRVQEAADAVGSACWKIAWERCRRSLSFTWCRAPTAVSGRSRWIRQRGDHKGRPYIILSSARVHCYRLHDGPIISDWL